MPLDQQPDYKPEISLDSPETPLLTSDKDIGELEALELVKQDYYAAEWFRNQNHDRRWNTHDALYFGWMPQKVWEGTNVPRSSLPMQITFDHIEAAIPAISQALFGSDEEWFQCAAEPGADPQEARAIQAHMLYALDHNKEDFSASAITEILLAIRQILLHGNGGISVEWGNEQPVVEWVDLRDLYFDAGLATPSVDAGRYIIRRRLMTVDELDAMRSDKRMKIPSRPVLLYMAKNLRMTYADRTKQIQEGLRGINYIPEQHDWNPNPADRKIEVLIYYSKSRVIWVLDRQHVAYNEKNPYGFTPFCFAPCFPVLNRCYAQSYADVLETIQRYIEGLLNGHLDEVHLGLHPPRVRRLGGTITPSQQRWRPGMDMGVQGDPKEWMQIVQPSGVTENVMSDIGYMEVHSEKRTGVNSTGQGVPRPGNANRTATGIESQTSGGASRLSSIVKNIEDYLIIPMLYKVYKLIQYHTAPGQTLPALGPEDQYIQVGADAFQQPVRFKMFASSTMMSREKLQGLFPFVSQVVMNGPLLEQLGKVGMTVDWLEFFQMMQDAVGTKRFYHLIRPMNPQEQQAAQQPSPELQAQQQKAQLDAQTRTQMGQMKAESDKYKADKDHDAKVTQAAAQHHAAITISRPDPMEAQMEMQKTKLEMQREMLKMAIEKALGQHKIQMQQQQGIMDAAQRQQEMQHQGRMAEQELMMNHLQGQQEMANNQAMAQTKIHHEQQSSQTRLAAEKAATSHKLKSEKAMGAQKIEHTGAMAKLKEEAARRKAAQKPSTPAKKK